jgi:hypothetical protein
MNRSLFLLSGLAIVATTSAQTGAPNWATYGRSFTHRSNAPAPTQDLNQVLWSTPVDRNRQYVFGSVLLIHYGSPLITHNNVVVVPVKTGAKDGWLIEGRNGTTGSLIYTFNTDYSIPSFIGLDWVPTFAPALSPDGRLYVPAAGGTILRRDNPEAATSTFTRLTFYGSTLFSADRATYSQNVKISTPITVDGNGNIYFGFMTFGTSIDRTKIGAAQLVSGLARITPAGVGTWRPVTAITSDESATHVQVNCAPALSPDGTIVYVGIKKTGGGGYLVGLNSTTLGLKYIRRLYDPATGNQAILTDQSSGAPMVGTDGDVYFGVLGNPHSRQRFRGFLLHYDKTLVLRKAIASFGWDTTPSLIPSSVVPSYNGLSPYLIITKYNNYAGGGGDGVNKVAVLDPNVTTIDPISGIPTMKEVLTVAGITPDPNWIGSHPDAVWEWCINATVVDYATRAALINSEDGRLYRWDFATNSITQGVLLDGPRGQAYTPTISGPTGIVYAINNGILFAVGV